MAITEIPLMPHHQRTIIDRALSQGLAFDDLEFTTEETSNQLRKHNVPKLTHLPTGYYFKFDGLSELVFDDHYTPNVDTQFYHQRHESLDERFNNVSAWASNVAIHIDALEYIASLKNAPDLQAYAVESNSNDFFNDEERAFLADKLDDIETRLTQFREFSDSELAQIRDQFQLLNSELAKSGKRSWLQMLIGVTVSIATTFLPDGVAAAAWMYINDSIGRVFRIGQ